MMLSDEARIVLLATLLILPLGALLHLRLRRGQRLVAFGLALAVLCLPAGARLVTVVLDHPPECPVLVPVAVHAAESVTVVERPPAFLVRLIEFELGLSARPDAVTGKIVLTGESFHLESPQEAGGVWVVTGSVAGRDQGGWPWVDLKWSRRPAGETASRRTRTFLAPGVIREQGASLSLLGIDVVPRAPQLGLLTGGPLERRLAMLVAEPLADGDQVVEIPFSGWWEDDREAVYRLLAQSPSAEEGSFVRRRPLTMPALAEVLAQCSPLALAVMLAGLVLLGVLTRFRVGTLALGAVAIVVIAAACDRLELAHAEAAMQSADVRQRAVGALHAGSIRLFRPSAIRLLEQRWLEEESPEVRVAIAAAVASQASADKPPAGALRLLTRIKMRSSPMNAAAEAMTTLVAISRRRR